ncbi:hypothetical protein AAH678_29635 [Sodalis endosymbiont of Spalangia cameroni]|uniref:hypothetical protein n=1 Tax=Sodalis praecaptivus TaxID=1239307 RepID=UPI0031F8FD96
MQLLTGCVKFMRFLTLSLFNKVPYLLLSFFLMACDELPKASSPAPLAPYRIALSEMGKDFQQEVSNMLIQQVVSGGENPTTATVTIEQSDLPDDAVQTERSIFKLAFRDGKWVIESRINQQHCYPDRGHQSFSTAPCH